MLFFAALCLGSTFGCAPSAPSPTFDDEVQRGWELKQFGRWEELERLGARLADRRPLRTEGHSFRLFAGCQLGDRAQALDALARLVRAGVLPGDLPDQALDLIVRTPEYANARESALVHARWLDSARRDPVLRRDEPARRFDSVVSMRETLVSERNAFVNRQDELSTYLRMKEWLEVLDQQHTDLDAAVQMFGPREIVPLQAELVRAYRCWPGVDVPPLAHAALGNELVALTTSITAEEDDRLLLVAALGAAMEGALRTGREQDALGHAAAIAATMGASPLLPDEKAALVVTRVGCIEGREVPRSVCEKAERWLEPRIASVAPWLLEGETACLEAAMEPVLSEVPRLALGVAEGATGPHEVLGEGLDPLGLHRFQGKYVLVDFWASWCQPCLDDVPELRDLADRTPELRIIGVNLDRDSDGWDRERVDALSRRLGIDWPVVHQPGGLEDVVPRHFGIRTLPAYVLFDPDGVPIHVETTSHPDLAKRIRARIDAR